MTHDLTIRPNADPDMVAQVRAMVRSTNAGDLL